MGLFIYAVSCALREVTVHLSPNLVCGGPGHIFIDSGVLLKGSKISNLEPISSIFNCYAEKSTKTVS